MVWFKQILCLLGCGCVYMYGIDHGRLLLMFINSVLSKCGCCCCCFFSIKIHACIIYIKYKYKNVGPLVCDAGIKIPI